MNLDAVIATLEGNLWLEDERIKTLQGRIERNDDEHSLLSPSYLLISNSLQLQLHFAMGRKHGLTSALSSLQQLAKGGAHES